MWECHCVQSMFLQELNIFTCQAESWGMQMGYDCGGSDTTLEVHQNSLHSFVRIHVPIPYSIRTLRGRNWSVLFFSELVKMQH